MNRHYDCASLPDWWYRFRFGSAEHAVADRTLVRLLGGCGTRPFFFENGTQTVLADTPEKTKKLKRGLIGHSMLCTTKPTTFPADKFLVLSL
jgi:hypothetical protein